MVVHVCCVRHVSFLGQPLLRSPTRISILLYKISQSYWVERQARQMRNVPVGDGPGVQLLVSTPACRQRVTRPPCRAWAAEPYDLGLNNKGPLNLRHGYKTAIFARRVPSQTRQPNGLVGDAQPSSCGTSGPCGRDMRVHAGFRHLVQHPMSFIFIKLHCRMIRGSVCTYECIHMYHLEIYFHFIHIHSTESTVAI